MQNYQNTKTNNNKVREMQVKEEYVNWIINHINDIKELQIA